MKQTNKIKKALLVYWLLLIYIIAALIWWFISLERQNITNTNLELNKIVFTKNTNLDKNAVSQLAQVENLRIRNRKKHISEGITFLAIIVVGAVYIYRLVKKQFVANVQQNNFIMAVTHELKTPIAIAQLNIETLLKRKVNEETQTKLLQNSLTEMQRLHDLTNNILVVSQIEHEGYQLKKEQTNINELIANTLKEIEIRQSNRIDFQNSSTTIITTIDVLLMQLVISNIVDNALKYSRDIVTISLEKLNNTVSIQVKDTGAGIMETEKEKIFEKFYRQENELTRKQKGTGLGLYLCKKIVNDHNGSITVENNKPTGSVFTITLNL